MSRDNHLFGAFFKAILKRKEVKKMSKKKKEQVHQNLVKFLKNFPEIDPEEWQRRRDVWIVSDKFLKKLSRMDDESFERQFDRLIDNLIDILPQSIEEGMFSGKLFKLCDELETIRTN